MRARLSGVEWLTMYQPSFGRCHSMFLPKWLKDLGIRRMLLKFKENVAIYTTYPGQMIIDEYVAGLTILKGDSLAFNLGYKVNKVVYLFLIMSQCALCIR